MNAIATIAERRRTRTFGLTEELAKGGFAKPAHISIRGNRFTLVNAQGDEFPWQSLALDVVIAGFNPVSLRVFYDPSKPYSPNAAPEDQVPLCSSDDGYAPREGVLAPQAATCAQCPRNAWGSDPKGGKGKACSEYKRLAVAVVGDPNPLAAYMFGISGGSHKNLRDYAKYVADLPAQNGMKPELETVITRVEFESQGVLKFTAIGWVDDATNARIDKLADTGLLDQVVGLGAQGGAALPAPAQAAIQREQERRAPAQQSPFQQGQLPPFGGSPAPVAPQPAIQNPPPNWGAPQAGTTTDAFHQLGGEKPKRHRRTKAEMEADRAAAMNPAPNATPMMQAPAFGAPPSRPQPQFGLVPSEQAPRPDAALQSAIDSVLGLPTEE